MIPVLGEDRRLRLAIEGVSIDAGQAVRDGGGRLGHFLHIGRETTAGGRGQKEVSQYIEGT